ncbi:SH3 domain-containing protein [Aliikangiella sp. G2MR2-5]|uniref:SH3 domain-containing protein n=1 Tax=Aliikangiella sp. G2MR2-5 TaxID=2788943 RepID=UPI0018A9ED6B|nr:SH3 domain-containing protein [Aliikangiella sp. G2MR2-5]
MIIRQKQTLERKRRKIASLVAFSVLFFTSLMLQAAPAILVLDTKVKSSPDFNANDVTTLKKDSVVEIIKRERGWYQINASEKVNGWVTLLQVRFAPVEQAASGSTLSKLVNLRKGHSSVTATTGVRGIGEQDLKHSKGNFDALEAASNYYISPAKATNFAKKAKLASTAIAYKEEGND